jgi:hypothetical protein
VIEEQTSFGHMLGPVLRETCRGRLGTISWFRATWQHGGAATGYSTWRCPSGQEIECVVKLPVGHGEYQWTKRLGLTSCHDWDNPDAEALPTPRVFAAGFELGSYDFAWIVMERFAGMPISHTPSGQTMWEIFETCAEFHAAAITERSIEADHTPPPPDWRALIPRGLKALEDNDLEHSERWVRGLHAVNERLDGLMRLWAAREINTWCHHDLHPGNAMRRTGADAKPGRCVLLDLAMVGAGHWIEDALYLERLNWGREAESLCGIDPVGTLAKARTFIGLPIGDDYEELADLRRLLMAASTPAFLRTEGHPEYLRAALQRLEGCLAKADTWIS